GGALRRGRVVALAGPEDAGPVGGGAGVAGAVAVGVLLPRVDDAGTVVADIAAAVPVPVRLVGVGARGAIVGAVGDVVLVAVGRQDHQRSREDLARLAVVGFDDRH